MIAAPPVIGGEPEQLIARHDQPSLPGKVSDLPSQPSVIGAVGWARDRRRWQQYGAFIWHTCLMPENRHNVN
jgi:hypothetical protein